MAIGRFAPSPTGTLHLGNLRTALLAWLFARSTGSEFLLRFEDLDLALIADEHYVTQRNDLNELGLGWDGAEVSQRDRTELYLDAIADFGARGLTYRCYCSRKDIREASQAPNGPQVLNHYPGTCRELTAAQQSERERSGRPAAIRVRAEAATFGFVDLVAGEHHEQVDDFVIQRNDQTPAYNLAVVVDDSLQGVEQVVRGDDLLASTTRQLFVADALDLAIPSYAHVPLVLAPSGKRLAKRDGATTLADRQRLGESPSDVLRFLGASIGLCLPEQQQAPQQQSQSVADVLAELQASFDPGALNQGPFTLTADYLQTTPS